MVRQAHHDFAAILRIAALFGPPVDYSPEKRYIDLSKRDD
jgi:hypothetical protein